VARHFRLGQEIVNVYHGFRFQNLFELYVYEQVGSTPNGKPAITLVTSGTSGSDPILALRY
jgi:hypothetical protein